MAAALERLAVLASHFPLTSDTDVRHRQPGGQENVARIIQDATLPVVIVGGVVLDVQVGGDHDAAPAFVYVFQ